MDPEEANNPFAQPSNGKGAASNARLMHARLAEAALTGLKKDNPDAAANFSSLRPAPSSPAVGRSAAPLTATPVLVSMPSPPHASKSPFGFDFPLQYGVYLPPKHAHILDIPSDSARTTGAGAEVDISACIGRLFRGEVPIFKDVECYYRSSLGARVLGTITATTYKVYFTPTSHLPLSLRHLHPSFFVAPVGMLRKIEKIVPRGRDAGSAFFVDVMFKDCRMWSLGFRDESLADKVLGHLRVVAFPHKIDFLHCFAEVGSRPDSSSGSTGGATSSSSSALPGWNVYNPYKELDRLGVLDMRHPKSGANLWRVTDINREYGFCPTYPSVLIFPERISDSAMAPMAHFRSKARVPAMTWMHPVNKSTMWRCSQPRVGMGNNVCREDEYFLSLIRDANVFARDPSIPLLIADCRPKANAMANKAGGWGYENYAFAQLEFLGIHNIHAVRDAYKKMEAIAAAPQPNDINWTGQLTDAGWIYNVRTVLSGAIFVAECMHRRGQSVVVHCSDGWDRTAQVCGLVQLMLDPFFRTLKGFSCLIAKEWASFGFKFHERCGHANEKSEDTDISPIFVQWLDAVYQLVTQFPNAFEFNARTLLVIAHHVHSCRFGDFLFNCERERVEARLPYRTNSFWEYLHTEARPLQLLNPTYDPALGDVLLPHPAACLRAVTVWADWFFRWSPYPAMVESVGRMERYPSGAYDHERVVEASYRGHHPTGVTPSPTSTGEDKSPEAFVDPLTGTPLETIPAVTLTAAAGSTGAGTGIHSAPEHVAPNEKPAVSNLFDEVAEEASPEPADEGSSEADVVASFLPRDEAGDAEGTDTED